MGPGLNWTSPLRDSKILQTQVTIDTLAAIVKKDNTEKYIVPLYVLRFNVSSIKKITKNIGLISLWWKSQSKKNNLGNDLSKKSYYTSMRGKKDGCPKSPLSHDIG